MPVYPGALPDTVLLLTPFSFLLAVYGLALGVPIAPATSRFVASLLYQVKPNDPGTLLAAVGILLAAALLAGFFPARRASRIDPMTALRHD